MSTKNYFIDIYKENFLNGLEAFLIHEKIRSLNINIQDLTDEEIKFIEDNIKVFE